jgi:hypothetical protein
VLYCSTNVGNVCRSGATYARRDEEFQKPILKSSHTIRPLHSDTPSSPWIPNLLEQKLSAREWEFLQATHQVVKQTGAIAGSVGSGRLPLCYALSSSHEYSLDVSELLTPGLMEGKVQLS